MYPKFKDIFRRSPNGYTERTILLDTDLKIILLDRQNSFVGTLKIISDAEKNFNTPATALSVLHNYFDSSTKLLFWSDPAKILDLSLDLSVNWFFPRKYKSDWTGAPGLHTARLMWLPVQVTVTRCELPLGARLSPTWRRQRRNSVSYSRRQHAPRVRFENFPRGKELALLYLARDFTVQFLHTSARIRQTARLPRWWRQSQKLFSSIAIAKMLDGIAYHESKLDRCHRRRLYRFGTLLKYQKLIQL